jgi:tRNA (cmo5U34)-methyltransferase
MRQAVDVPGVRFIAVDNSPVMIERCRQALCAGDGEIPVELLEEDICRVEVRNASMSVLNFTLQFVEPRRRLGLLERIAWGTRPGGVLVLSEKIRFSRAAEQELQTALYHDLRTRVTGTGTPASATPLSGSCNQTRKQFTGSD